MWIFTPTGFVSAVQHTGRPGFVLVRARDRLSLTSVVTEGQIEHTPTADYPYRATVTIEDFADWTRSMALGIDYSNFKDQVASTRGRGYAHALLGVWSTMHDVEDADARQAAVASPALSPEDTELPGYVVDRIRRPYPDGAGVVPGSTPVISFGDPTAARVATLGINASYDEFIYRGDILKYKSHDPRLVHLQQFELSGPEQMSAGQAAEVARACYSYFSNDEHHAWFYPMQKCVLDPLGVSYRDGSACHLDIVQWSTHAVWSKVDKQVRPGLILADAQFLQHQLRDSGIELLFINGATVVEQFKALPGAQLQEVGREALGETSSKTTLYRGWLEDVPVLGVSANIPDSHTGSKRCQGISEWIQGQSVSLGW